MKYGRVRSVSGDAEAKKNQLNGTFPVSHFFELMDCVDDFVLLMDEELSIEKANRNSTVYTGYSEEELRTKSILSILDEKEKKKMLRIVGAAKTRRGGETVIRTKARTKLRIEYSVSPLRGERGGLEGYLLVGRPAATGKADSGGYGNRELRRRILDSIAEPLFVINSPSRTIIECNQCAVNLSKFRASDMIGRTIFEFISFGEEGESVESRIARVNEAYAKVGFFRSNVRFSRRTGPPILCECFGIPFLGEGGRADLTIVALIDRSTEERRRVLLADFADRAGKFASDLAQFSESAAVRVEGKRLSRLGFTPRQVEIARFVFEGCPSKEIGYKLGIAESTVKNHLAAMFKKIGATSRVDFLHKLIEERIWIA